MSQIKDPVEYLYALQHFGVKLGLERMEWFMQLLNHPEQKFKSIHVAGTNGKGSVCAFLASIFRKAGYKVGLYTSPHLIKFNERIQVNGEQITDAQLAQLTTYIRDNVADAETTFFEFTTAIAFEHFAKEHVDIAIIEVGLGGDLDATTVVTPIASVITNISLEHTKALGSTKREIAEKKAGVIKEGVPLITAELDPDILAYFKSECSAKNSTLIQVPSIIQNESEDRFQHFTFDDKQYSIVMQGAHQITNAATALTVLEHAGFDLSEQDIWQGLQNTHWQGRLQKISEHPQIILDGAHNKDAAQKIEPFIQKLENRKVLMIAISRGKDVASMMKSIAPHFEHVIITQSSFKPEEMEAIEQEAEKYCSSIICIQKSADAFTHALSLMDKNDTLFITGSLYMLGDVMRYLENNKQVLELKKTFTVP